MTPSIVRRTYIVVKEHKGINILEIPCEKWWKQKLWTEYRKVFKQTIVAYLKWNVIEKNPMNSVKILSN